MQVKRTDSCFLHFGTLPTNVHQEIIDFCRSEGVPMHAGFVSQKDDHEWFSPENADKVLKFLRSKYTFDTVKIPVTL